MTCCTEIQKKNDFFLLTKEKAVVVHSLTYLCRSAQKSTEYSIIYKFLRFFFFLTTSDLLGLFLCPCILQCSMTRFVFCFVWGDVIPWLVETAAIPTLDRINYQRPSFCTYPSALWQFGQSPLTSSTSCYPLDVCWIKKALQQNKNKNRTRLVEHPCMALNILYFYSFSTQGVLHLNTQFEFPSAVAVTSQWVAATSDIYMGSNAGLCVNKCLCGEVYTC